MDEVKDVEAESSNARNAARRVASVITLSLVVLAAILVVIDRGGARSAPRAAGTTTSEASTTSGATSNTPAALDPVTLSAEFRAIAEEFTAADNSTNPTVSAAAAAAAAEAETGTTEPAGALLGYWTSAERTPQEVAANIQVLADHRLVWLIRFGGLELHGHGPSSKSVNHELNVMVEANSGVVIGTVTYR